MCIQILGAVVSGIGAAMAASQQAAQYKAQAQIHDRQANLERERGAFEARRMEERGSQLIGRQIAGFASSGLQIDGSIAGVVQSTGLEAGLDVAAARYGSRINRENEEILAKVNRSNAKAASAAIPFAFLSPVIGSLGSVGTSLRGAYG